MLSVLCFLKKKNCIEAMNGLRYFFRVKNECRGLLGDEGDGQAGAMRQMTVISMNESTICFTQQFPTEVLVNVIELPEIFFLSG